MCIFDFIKIKFSGNKIKEKFRFHGNRFFWKLDFPENKIKEKFRFHGNRFFWKLDFLENKIKEKFRFHGRLWTSSLYKLPSYTSEIVLEGSLLSLGLLKYNWFQYFFARFETFFSTEKEAKNDESFLPWRLKLSSHETQWYEAFESSFSFPI